MENPVKNYRPLTPDERQALEANSCTAVCWDDVEVAEGFRPDHVRYCRFSGKVRLGRFDGEFTLPGGISKHSGVSYATLHNVTVGDNSCVENIRNYIANYTIGEHTFIDNVDILLVDGESTFGNGIPVAVLNETGGREVLMHDRLSSHQAYIMAQYRYRTQAVDRLRRIIGDYAQSRASSHGHVGDHVTIVNAGYIKNVRVGDYTQIEGTGRLKNGSVNSTAEAPVHIGHGVVCDDFIISSGSSVEDGTTLTRCFVGQACSLGHNYSASDSLFFCNCQQFNGEACAVFAGPFTVTHHKSTLLIAGMFSFMNAGSGSNQSNHMYKLGPIHQGTMERGAKTSSDSYILWPARIGAFSLVMGRHVSHPDTSSMPFSYLIEDNNTSYLVPGVNLRSVGTIRDVKKWPQRDRRRGERLDQVNFNLLSPFTIRKMMAGRDILRQLRRLSGETSDTYSFQSAKIKHSSLVNGIRLYELAITKFLGNSIIQQLKGVRPSCDEELRECLRPTTAAGGGEWVDLSGLIAPKSEVDALLEEIENGRVADVDTLHLRFEQMHRRYYDYEWTWARSCAEEFFGVKWSEVTAADIVAIVRRWQEAVTTLDRMIYDDARKEFSLSSMTGFGTDGSREERDRDFEQVRGIFESNPFVMSVLEHIEAKTALGNELIGRISPAERG